MRRAGIRRILRYAEEADDDVNKVSRRPGVHPVGEHIINKSSSLPVIATCKAAITSELVYEKSRSH